MFDDRSLSRREGALRRNSSTDLTDAMGDWYSVGPQHPDERWSVQAIEVTVAGTGLLDGLGRFGRSDAVLEIAFDQFDAMSGVHDVDSAAYLRTAARREFAAGSHVGTTASDDAVRFGDGGRRSGLQGTITGTSSPGDTMRWTGPEMPTRYGRSIRGATWEITPVMGHDGEPLDAITVVLRTGVDAAGITTWTDTVVVGPADQLESGALFTTPLDADRLQWVVQFTAVAAADAAWSDRGPLRTPSVQSLGVWIETGDSPLQFHRLAELVQFSDLERTMMRGGWDGSADVAVLRLPVPTSLAGRHGESMRARLVSGADTPPVDVLELTATGELVHEPLEDVT